MLKNFLILGGCLLIIIYLVHNVNDKLGHPVGDKVVKDAAVIFRSIFRDKDLICRLGGDEFCIFTKGLTDKDIIIQRADILQNQGERTYSSPDGNINIMISFSIGIAIYYGNTSITYEQLYEQADLVLYQAKKSGRNTYCLKELMA